MNREVSQFPKTVTGQKVDIKFEKDTSQIYQNLLDA